MEKPKIEDFEIKSHNCWGTTTYRADYYAYSQALEKYINTSEPQLKQADVSGQFADLLQALDKIDAGNYGSAKNFIERYINSENCH